MAIDTNEKAPQRLSDGGNSYHSECLKFDTSTDDQDPHHEKHRFDAVLANINLKCVPQLASGLRMREKKVKRSPAMGSLLNMRYSCKVVTPALRGSFNILFPIRFRDKTEWLLKVPANGCDGWDEQSARALTSEVLTMKLIYNNSSIPVPRIYGFDPTPNNPIKCPYIMMERIKGTPLHHGWFQEDGPAGSLDIFRERALKDLAETMVQLNSFTFTKVGALHYNASNKKMDVGPYKKVDYYAEYNRSGSATDDDETIFVEQGPFLDPKQYFLASLDNEKTTELHHMLQGERKLLRLFIDWLFEATSEDNSEFVLTHPDFNLQNVLVGKDGSLKGLVDWDGVAAVPRCIGCEQYPLWLTPDWDPHWYNYDTEAECVIDEDEGPEMSPEDLDVYRKKYATYIEAALQKRDLDQPSSSSMEDSHDSLRFSMTKVSSLARSLYISANEPISAARIVSMILRKVMALTSEADYGDAASEDGDSELSNIEEGSEDNLTDITEPSEVSETMKGVKGQSHSEYCFSIEVARIRKDVLTGIAGSNTTNSITPEQIPDNTTACTTLVGGNPVPEKRKSETPDDTTELHKEPSSTKQNITTSPLKVQGVDEQHESSSTHTSSTTNEHPVPASPPAPHASTSGDQPNSLDNTTDTQQPTNNTRLSGSTTTSRKERLDAIAKKWKDDPTHDFGTFTGRNIYNA
ncbi:MAG: hypothetical protein L6R38_009643, partial [Xanthoria sp. 2 TBL-2021]